MELLPILLVSLVVTEQVANRSPAAERDFESKVHETLETLAQEHTSFPPEDATDEESSQCTRTCRRAKKAIRGLMEACQAAEPRARQIRRHILCRAFSESLEQPGEFRFFEYYIVWLSIPSSARRRAILAFIAGSLVKKLDDALTKPAIDESAAVVCAAAIRLLLAITEYDGRIFRDGDEIERQEWPSFNEWLQILSRFGSPEGFSRGICRSGPLRNLGNRIEIRDNSRSQNRFRVR